VAIKGVTDPRDKGGSKSGTLGKSSSQKRVRESPQPLGEGMRLREDPQPTPAGELHAKVRHFENQLAARGKAKDGGSTVCRLKHNYKHLRPSGWPPPDKKAGPLARIVHGIHKSSDETIESKGVSKKACTEIDQRTTTQDVGCSKEEAIEGGFSKRPL